jgi:hypothetical protein
MDEAPPQLTTFFWFLAALVLELAMLTLFYATYSETMGMMSDVYLCDLPGAGMFFCEFDDEMTVSHLLSFLLAVFSIIVPIAIWSQVLGQKIFDDLGGWLSNPANRVWTIIALAVYGLVFLLETVNLYMLIARASVQGPFALPGAASPMTTLLAQNKGLGVFVAVMIATVNAVLAFVAVSAARNVKRAIGG